MKFNNLLPDIQYHGLPGISRACQDAVQRLLQYGEKITLARILSCSGDHCLLLTINDLDLIAIKSGFSSGYPGEGPRTFSYVLQLLNDSGARIKEYKVKRGLIIRLDNNSLTKADLEKLEATIPVRPLSRWNDYVYEEHWESERDRTLWKEFPPIIPFAIIDSRIIDLAMSFWENPDEKLLTGYRRLEDIVRERTGIDKHSSKLFTQAFGPKSKLCWKDLDNGEQDGKASLFTETFKAHRNPRAHREIRDSAHIQLSEFLLLNHLYSLEKSAIENDGEG